MPYVPVFRVLNKQHNVVQEVVLRTPFANLVNIVLHFLFIHSFFVYDI